ncbi:MAG: hypothetical protein KGL11_01770 [Alphaproteobacteria bacterium]|nr:hypothetical protein [Alphaproteobacteria bacterium]
MCRSRGWRGPTRQALLDTIADTGTFDLGGVALTFSPASNHGSNRVFLTVIAPDGGFVPVATLKRRATAAGEISSAPQGGD